VSLTNTKTKIDSEILNELGQRIIDVAREIFNRELVVSTFGVVSARIPGTDCVLITPSGFSKAKLETRNLIVSDLDGRVLKGKLRPSVETPMHLFIHKKRNDLLAVLHTHSTYATAFAAANRGVPCISSEQAFYLGGSVPLVANYSLPGTTNKKELQSIVDALKETNAALLRKHGAVVVGKNLDEALDTAIVLEDVAKQAFFSMLISPPVEFTKNEIDRLKIFKQKRYGQRKPEK
jgi:L-ribulose-5-phosphate 4-epimerase